MEILLVDNYDSFVYNIANSLGQLGASVRVVRNSVPLDDALTEHADAIVLSPGPGHPRDSRLTMDVLTCNLPLPVLGVCLGHQAIAEAFGGRVVRAKSVLHGKSSAILHSGKGLFHGVDNPLSAVRYHSLAIERDSLPHSIQILAQSGDGEIMAVMHRSKPIFGVQFHPESVLTRGGKRILQNFLKIAQGCRGSNGVAGGKKGGVAGVENNEGVAVSPC